MSWRVAKSLLHLRDQVNLAAPTRSKRNDGTIGDAAHAARTSDHNPWVEDNGVGVVTAMDITNDPKSGVVSREIAEALVKSRDKRIKYIISNREIVSATVAAWQWRPYSGENPHTEHVHVSVSPVKRLYDDLSDWALPLRLGKPSAPPVTPPSTGPEVAFFTARGRGSWFSQYRGKYVWIDEGDEPGSNALGVPDDAQGISFYSRPTLGNWYLVKAPNGIISVEQQTDIGPNPRLNRLIDISAAAAERFGYSPRDFPTDAEFQWRRLDTPKVLAGLSPQKAAIKARDLRRAGTPLV